MTCKGGDTQQTFIPHYLLIALAIHLLRAIFEYCKATRFTKSETTTNC